MAPFRLLKAIFSANGSTYLAIDGIYLGNFGLFSENIVTPLTNVNVGLPKDDAL